MPFAIETLSGSRNTTIAGNDLIGNWVGVLVDRAPGTKILSNDITDSTASGMLILDSPGTKILSNDISRFGDSGITIFGPERANNDAKVVGNNISGGPAGIYVARRSPRLLRRKHDPRQLRWHVLRSFHRRTPVSGFEVKANTVENNTRSCRAGQFEEAVASRGSASRFWARLAWRLRQTRSRATSPPAPPAVSGGVVVSTNPFFGGSAKPRNNSVTGNTFGRNKPDIFWDKSGSGNSFVGNLCNTSVPTSLCN